MTTFLSPTNTNKHTQLEEANRTLTNDVANLAYEKEELNNKLKDMMEGECFPLLPAINITAMHPPQAQSTEPPGEMPNNALEM